MDIAIQYLEPGPETAVLRPFEVRERLRAALATLPITHVILGWNASDQQVEVCAEETDTRQCTPDPLAATVER